VIDATFRQVSAALSPAGSTSPVQDQILDTRSIVLQ
jgi:hypothetical protein